MAGTSDQIAIFLLTLIYLYSTKGATQLECGPYQCPSQQVQYQCNVTGVTTMNWRVINDSMTLDDQSYNIGNTPSSSADVLTDASEFSTVLSSVSSSPQLIMSSIIFTGQTNINGYTIECDALGGDKENCSIVITGIPFSPDNVTIHTDTFTISSVNISWTESSSPCVTGYRYNISSSALEENIVMESTSNSVMVEGINQSNEQYNVSVTAIDTANRTSSGSDPVGLIFNVPQFDGNLEVTSPIIFNENTTNITFTWKTKTFEGSFFPSIIRYEASLLGIDNTTVRNEEIPVTTVQQHMFDDIPTNAKNYTLILTAMNGVGDNSINTTFDINKLPTTLSLTTTVTESPASTITISAINSDIASVSPTSTTTTPPEDITTTDDPTPGPPYIPIIVPVVIILILIIIVIILVIVYCVYRNRDRGSASDPIPLKEKHTTRAQPETGQPTYENPNDAVQHKQAPTGDLYAQPDVKPGSSGRRPQPQPTYQDPDTIQRQQGPTGDMYAMPDRKPANIQVKKPGPGELYADLDLSTNSPRSPQPLLPSESPQQHQPVLYSDVQHLR